MLLYKELLHLATGWFRKKNIMTTIKVPLYGFISSRVKRLFNVAKVAQEQHLRFSSFDEVGNGVIAIDTIKRKLFYLNNAPNDASCLIIDLQGVDGCTIKKQYDGINAGDLHTRNISHFLKSIFLHLSFKNNAAAVTLSLYQAQNDKFDDVEQLEAKAKKWETIVSTLLPAQLLERA
jgi:hypothetical protein